MTVWGVISGLVVFFACGFVYGFFPWGDPDEYHRRRQDARARREIARCRKARALSALRAENCPEDHGSGSVVLFVDRRPSETRFSVLWGLIKFTREIS
jgi:hypothetical protein